MLKRKIWLGAEDTCNNMESDIAGVRILGRGESKVRKHIGQLKTLWR